MTEFNSSDPKHAQAIADLEFLTGLEFKLTQADSSSGKLWVYRTTTPSTYVEGSELLNLADGISALNLTDPELLAHKNGILLGDNLEMLCKPLGEVCEATRDGKDGTTRRWQAIKVGDGQFKGVTDYYAETIGNRYALRTDVLRETVDKIQNPPAPEKPKGLFSFFKKSPTQHAVEPYTPPTLGAGFTRPLTPENLEKIEHLKAERIKNLGKIHQELKENPHPNFELSDSKKAALDAIENTKHQDALDAKKDNGKGFSPSLN